MLDGKRDNMLQFKKIPYLCLKMEEIILDRNTILEAIHRQEQQQGSPMNERAIQVFLANNFGFSPSQSKTFIAEYLSKRNGKSH